MIKIYSWNPTKLEQDLLYRLLNATFGEEEPKLIIDLNTSEVDLTEEDIAIACGTRCYNIVTAAAPTGMLVTKIPIARNLTNAPANIQNRNTTFKTLQDLFENKDTVIIPEEEIDPKDLQSFSISQLVHLKSTLESKGIEYWLGKTKEGKKIAIVLDPHTKVQNCHAILTFEEIFAAKFAVEILNLESLTLVTGDK